MTVIIDRPFIQYSLTKTRTFQSVGQSGIKNSWDKIKTFLTLWTTADPDSPTVTEHATIDLTIYSNYNDELTDKICDKAVNTAEQKFGKGQRKGVGLIPTDNSVLPRIETCWRIDTRQFPDSVSLLLDVEPWPRQKMGPVELLFSYDFQLKNVSYKNHPDLYKSDLMVGLLRNSLVTPTLNFPFEEPTKEFWNYIEQIEPFFPFKWDNKNLRVLKPNKKRTGFISSKV